MDRIPAEHKMLRIIELFEPGNTIAWDFLTKFDMPWEALPAIGGFIAETGAGLDANEYDVLPNNVWIHKSASIAASAYIGKSVIICAEAEVRHCAFIRENALIGKGAVVGNSSELKNVILFDKVQVPHFNYVGDSILGHKSHLGAGAITSNVKSDRSPVSVICGEDRIGTGLKKFGAILGDDVEIGCNSVLNPGSVIGPRSIVYPLSMVRGYVPADSIYKNQGEIAKKR